MTRGRATFPGSAPGPESEGSEKSVPSGFLRRRPVTEVTTDGTSENLQMLVRKVNRTFRASQGRPVVGCYRGRCVQGRSGSEFATRVRLRGELAPRRKPLAQVHLRP